MLRLLKIVEETLSKQLQQKGDEALREFSIEV